MPYKVKSGKINYFDETFGTEKAAKEAKYFAVLGAKTNRTAFKAMDAKIIKVAKTKKRKK